MTNLFKASDIKLSTDSMGYITAEHKYQGRLIDSHPFWENTGAERRRAARREAVKALKQLKA